MSKNAKLAAAALIRANPTWSDERVWAALKEAGFSLDDKAFVADVRYELGAKHTWKKEE